MVQSFSELPRQSRAVLIDLESETMIRWSGTGDIDFTAICGVPYALLDQQLLKCRELFGSGLIAHGLPGVHRSDLAHHRFDPRIMCRNLDDVTPLKLVPHTPSRSLSTSGCKDSQVNALR
jgi:hypothetical protein